MKGVEGLAIRNPSPPFHRCTQYSTVGRPSQFDIQCVSNLSEQVNFRSGHVSFVSWQVDSLVNLSNGQVLKNVNVMASNAAIPKWLLQVGPT